MHDFKHMYVRTHKHMLNFVYILIIIYHNAIQQYPFIILLIFIFRFRIASSLLLGSICIVTKDQVYWKTFVINGMSLSVVVVARFSTTF